MKLKDTKAYGDYGVALATLYFLGNGYQVLSPFGDRGHYDLVVELNNSFQKVQCKWTSRTTIQGYPAVSLRVGGTPKKNGATKARFVVYHKYTINDFDLLWVATPFSCYLIPFKDILNGKTTKADLKICPKWDKYRVAIPIPHRDESDSKHKRLSPRLTNNDKSLIKRLHKEKMPDQQIADILDVSIGCISAFRSRNHPGAGNDAVKDS